MCSLMEKIGTLIRNHRLKKKMTQEELGSRVFVTKQAVSKWETGKALPDIEMMRNLCAILDISKDEILGSSIEETKKSYRLYKIFRIIAVIGTLVAIMGISVSLFFALDGPGYIDRHTQAGVAYVSVFEDGHLLMTDEYVLTSDLPFEDYAKAYKAPIDYGRVRGNVSLRDYNIDFGFENTNNWHNAHIRLDISSHDSRLKVTQTVQYETDSNMYEVFINEDTATDNTVSVFGGGV